MEVKWSCRVCNENSSIEADVLEIPGHTGSGFMDVISILAAGDFARRVMESHKSKSPRCPALLSDLELLESGGGKG